MNATPSVRLLACDGLRSLDVSTLRLFLGLADGRTSQRWAIGDAARADLLLLPWGEPEPASVGPEVAVVRVVEAGVPEAKGMARHLNRPLQFEAVLALLQEAELGLLAPRRDFEDTWVEAAPSALAAPAVAAPAPATPAPRLVAARPATPTPTPAPAPAPAPVPALEPGARYRLKRWPSAASLVAHRYLPRLASCLSARALTLEELTQLAHVSRLECRAFLHDMAAQGILRIEAARPLPAAVHLSGAAVPLRVVGGPRPTGRSPQRQDMAPQTAPLLGLVGRLRQRLGLG